MGSKPIKGIFNVIDSFAIRSKNEFYLIGMLIEGEMISGWYCNIILNKSLSLTLAISNIEKVEMSGDKGKYSLITVYADNEDITILLGLNIGIETINITVDGKD